MIAPLKVTTDYTLLSSLIKVKDLITFCVKKNIKSCAICDTNLFGSIEFYKLCKSNNIKPIIGLEVIFESSIVVAGILSFFIATNSILSLLSKYIPKKIKKREKITKTKPNFNLKFRIIKFLLTII